MTTTAPQSAAPARAAAGIDPRGPQLTAGITAAVLVAILLLPSPWAAVLTGVQAVLFAVGATRGVQHTPHAWLFRTFVRPRLAPPGELEDPAPPRFAQGVGLGFTLVALVCLGVGQSVAGLTLLGQVAIGLALVAALLNAVFRFCLGCEMYLLLKRFQPHASDIRTHHQR
jgi:disulfide bond formation protein DsbB